MPKTFSADLRERVWRAYTEGERSQPKVAKDFGVSASFVRNLVRRHRETGSLAPKPHAGGRPPALDEQGLERLARAVADTPDATLEELCTELRRRHRLQLSLSSVWRSLGFLKLTRKKEGPLGQRKKLAPRAGAAP